MVCFNGLLPLFFEAVCVSAVSLHGDSLPLAVLAVVKKGYRLFRSKWLGNEIRAKLLGCQATRATPATPYGHFCLFFLIFVFNFTVTLYFFPLTLVKFSSLQLSSLTAVRCLSVCAHSLSASPFSTLLSISYTPIQSLAGSVFVYFSVKVALSKSWACQLKSGVIKEEMYVWLEG